MQTRIQTFWSWPSLPYITPHYTIWSLKPTLNNNPWGVLRIKKSLRIFLIVFSFLRQIAVITVQQCADVSSYLAVNSEWTWKASQTSVVGKVTHLSGSWRARGSDPAFKMPANNTLAGIKGAAVMTHMHTPSQEAIQSIPLHQLARYLPRFYPPFEQYVLESTPATHLSHKMTTDACEGLCPALTPRLVCEKRLIDICCVNANQ